MYVKEYIDFIVNNIHTTVVTKARNVYSICSLYSYVQVMEIPPFLHKGRQHFCCRPLTDQLQNRAGLSTTGVVRSS